MTFFRWVLAGVVATLIMDVGSTLIRKTGFTAGLEPKHIGRWFASIARGEPLDGTILESPSVPGEVAVALVGHYLIGITLALVLGFLQSISPWRAGLAGATGLVIGFSLLTNLLPWLVMFPDMGLGWFGRSAPPELLLLRSSLTNHLVFAAGLAASTRLFGVLA
jgi:Protein of unknown function (DUF2938)